MLRVLAIGWILIMGGTLALVVFPRLAFLIPHPEYIRVFLVLFVPVSALYGLICVYRKGTQRNKK